MWWNRWWQIDWFRSDLWFPERRQEVRGQVPSGQSRCKSLKVIPSSEFRSTTVRAERCWRRRRTTRRRSGVLAVVLLSTRRRRPRMTKQILYLSWCGYFSCFVLRYEYERELGIKVMGCYPVQITIVLQCVDILLCFSTVFTILHFP